MIRPPTLADLVIRESFRSKHHRCVAVSARDHLSVARRFVLDKDATAFVAELATNNYLRRTIQQAMRAFENTRVLARLPHAVSWIELNLGDLAEAELAMSGKTLETGNAAELLRARPRIGWLLRQHPQIETAFRMSCFMEEIEADGATTGHAVMRPFDFAWMSDEAPMPWRPVHFEEAKHAMTTALGMVTEDDETGRTFFSPNDYDRVLTIDNDQTPDEVPEKDLKAFRKMIVNDSGDLRRVLSLLAAINDVPVGVKKVVAAKGFVAQGRYRKFLDHAVVSIDLPKGRDRTKAMRAIISKMRRRAHQVRGHWRRDWRHAGLRIWIREHQRGDASVGFVTHDYAVHHHEE